jgi:hypothetical protein
VIGQLKTATPDGTTGSPTTAPNASPCSSSTTWIGGQGNAVYYTFTPSLSTSYSIGVCNPNNVWDSVVSVHTSCPTSQANSLACNDDGACAGGVGLSFINAVPLDAGVTYVIRVAAYTTSTTFNNGEFLLQVTGDPIGACCKTDGACSPFTAANCSSAGGTYQGDGIACGSVTCTGACCNNASGACTATGPANCGAGSMFNGVGTTCSSVVCPGVACCNPDTAACTRTGPDGCSSPNTNQGDVACSPTPCPGGACCTTGSTACTFTGMAGCASGFQGLGSTCTPNPCAGACCDSGTGACTLGPSIGGCAGGLTFQGAGTACTPTNPCPQPPPPDNNLCANASPIVVDAGPISGTTINSTQTYTTAPAGFCSGSTYDVYYQFTTTGPGSFGISMTNASLLSVLVLANCGDTTTIACSAIDFDNAIPSFSVPGAGTYYIRVAAYGGDQGPFTIEIHTVILGACCNDTTGACTTTATGACSSGATYQGDNTSCDPAPCVQGACCDPNLGACTLASGAANCAAGTIYQGDGTSCSPGNPCPQPPPPDNDDCTAAIPLTLNVAYQGNNISASDDSVIPTCQSSSHKGVWFTFTPAVSGNYLVSSCGSTFDCILSIWSGADCGSLTSVACDDDSCNGGSAGADVPNPGPSDPGSGAAAKIASATLTAGQTYHIMLSSYSGYSGAFGIIVQCPTCPQSGICCRGATCTTSYSDATACTNSLAAGTIAGAAFVAGSACNAGGSTSSPCCYPDYNKTGGITVGDIFDFLNDWFAGYKYANVGGDGVHGTLAVQNIFDFLNAWFAGGC